MTKGRDKVAESLSDILQMISSRKRSGLLSVERYEAGRFEEGEIYFQKGRPVHARYGTLSAQESLPKLLAWRNVYYKFIADGAAPPTSVLPDSQTTIAPLRPTTGPITPPLRNTTGSLPAPAWSTQESPAPSSSRAAQNLPVTGPQSPLRHTQPPTPMQGRTPNPPERTMGHSLPRDTSDVPGLEGLVPRRLNNEQNVLSLPLTRTRRSIFLLVDGDRTLADLARCTSKTVQEVGRILEELQQLGFVLL
jgi:uncharacterized protein DUF4388